ncbi:glutathione S-transferase family protein [uncultured Roseobacter sp.]|uniref:glutathione S-transferase family protein n=1 Tax=uncultured Roseobacter sp. TaxID=114847 RepID=UPI00260886AF|nr:glutathione S-transferase family protein [uncultured Roseobacter sp.]
MTLTLTTISGSPRGWRVLLGLAFKRLSTEIKELKLSENEHKTEPFISLNPRGTVPVMESDGTVLRDSMAILAWLDRKFPEHPLFGSTDQEAAEIWQATMEGRQYLRQAAADFLTPVFFGGASLDDKNTPKWESLTSAAETMQSEMTLLDGKLSDGRLFLAGMKPSAADAVSWPEVRLVQRASETKPDLMAELGFAELANTLDHLEAWKQRVFDCPGVEATMPGHW